MEIKTYEITLTGQSPLLHHYDNIEWSDMLKEWRAVPENAKESVPGDDRSPGFTWLGALYHNGEHATIPSDNLMRCFMEGGALVPVPGGRSGKTFKSQTQSGMLVKTEHWPILIGGDGGKKPGRPIAVKPLLAMSNVRPFKEHLQAAQAAGFKLFMKRARIGQKKHVRVRPRFETWSAGGLLDVWDQQLTLATLRDILKMAGGYRGIGDWRPSAPKSPGPFGRFTAEITEVKGGRK